jgi:hypothetical protein
MVSIAASLDTSSELQQPMRILLFLAIVANSLDLVATALGIYRFGNREGNPLLAELAHHWWPLFVVVKGLLIPTLIVLLYRYRRSTPLLAHAGMALVTVALTVAVGQWIGWMAGVLHVASMARF